MIKTFLALYRISTEKLFTFQLAQKNTQCAELYSYIKSAEKLFQRFAQNALGCRYCVPLALGSTGFEKCYLATKSNYYYFYYYYIFVFYIWIRRCPKQLCNMHFTRSLAAECPFTLSTRHLNWKCGFDVTRSGLILIISYIRPQMQVHT